MTDTTPTETSTERADLDSARRIITQARAAYAQMGIAGTGIGSLHRDDQELYDAWVEYDDVTTPLEHESTLPEQLLAEVDRLHEVLAEVAKHQEDMADSLDDSVTHEQIHEQLLIGMRLAADARG